MRLYFLRHADAVPGEPDEGRPLSELGIDQSRALGRFLRESHIAFDAAYSSPLVRARDTAERVLEICNDTDPLLLQIAEPLGFGAAGSEFDRWMRSIPDEKHVLLVGHNPGLSDHVRRLTGGWPEEHFSFPKGGMVCLKTEDRRNFVWKFFLPPRLYLR
ncbi:MAG TPA: phosphohistidine phosphatase SixA [Roseimicrobium sp.]|nr:phosphohistidine phosphatase SixA [Roseimicrobium sp.]